MKNKILITLFLAFAGNGFSQCPTPGSVVPVQMVMNVATAQDYTKCDIRIEAAFVSSSVSNFRHPGRFKKTVVFQAAPRGEEDNYRDARGQRGLFVAIQKEEASKIFSLKKGDKLTIRGNTFVVYGIVYFEVSSYELGN